jgi:hypothetical protein
MKEIYNSYLNLRTIENVFSHYYHFLFMKRIETLSLADYDSKIINAKTSYLTTWQYLMLILY